MDSLTPRQADVFRFICQQINDRGFPPSVREIGQRFEILSPNGVMCHLIALEKKGFISREKHISRGIKVLKQETA